MPTAAQNESMRGLVEYSVPRGQYLVVPDVWEEIKGERMDTPAVDSGDYVRIDEGTLYQAKIEHMQSKGMEFDTEYVKSNVFRHQGTDGV